ncbi:protein FAR1-RELATED SEQUENCE 5-like [Camellia sinensis]|uniref:protein FAR1-RELATED SEQUENCE 5-like n=1 Tax=Camellia sinensis TaxID=4442 RepID=UPI001036D2E4|nr:protein FAR1-RELATED SEQUENCE 5-like [Camellia sinensis]
MERAQTANQLRSEAKDRANASEESLELAKEEFAKGKAELKELKAAKEKAESEVSMALEAGRSAAFMEYLCFYMDMEPDNDCGWKPKVGMTFDSEESAYDFYNAYGRRMGFSIRREYCKKNKLTKQIISRNLVCNKEGFRKVNKRDPLTKTPRAETRTGCEARLFVKLDVNSGKFVVIDFKEKHNHEHVSLDCAHMLSSQRKISDTQAIELDLASESGLCLGQSFELMGREAGGKSLDNEEQITNMFWADAQMVMDYAQFGDVVTFDTTYKLNKEHRPFASFVGCNHHRETVVFGAALLYDKTAETFVWLFQTFLEAMSKKAPKTLFTDEDAAMAKAIPIVMPDTSHRLCTWHLMQNALRHVGEMLDTYDAHDNHWLKLIFGVKEKWGWPYVRSTWVAGMSTTQLSESFNAFLKDYIRSDFNLNEFFMHFERVHCEKRYKELETGYALCQRLPRVRAPFIMLSQMDNVYTKNIFEEFQDEYFLSVESEIQAIEYIDGCSLYTVVDAIGKNARKVTMEMDGSLACSCSKFEKKGILCSHCLKVMREILKLKEIPSQYIMKRWTKQAREEAVMDKLGNEIQIDVKFKQASRYKTLMTAFRSIACRAAETEESYDFCCSQVAALGADVKSKISAHFCPEKEVSINDQPQTCEQEDNNHVVKIPIGLKKKHPTSKGKRRIKGPCELALQASFKKKSRAQFLSSSRPVAAPTVRPSPLSIGGDVSIYENVTPLHPPLAPPPPPHSVAMGGTIPLPLIYPTYNANNLAYCGQPTFMTLLQGGYAIGFEDSQGSQTGSRPTNNLMLYTEVLLLLIWVWMAMKRWKALQISCIGDASELLYLTLMLMLKLKYLIVKLVEW